MNGLIGSQVKEPNIALRFLMLTFLGILGFSLALGWRGSLLMATEYQEMPTTKRSLELKKKNMMKQERIMARERRK